MDLAALLEMTITSCHNMETRSASPVLCGGNLHHWSPVDSPFTVLVMRKSYVCFVVSLNKLLNKESDWEWFETPWLLRDVILMEFYRFEKTRVFFFLLLFCFVLFFIVLWYWKKKHINHKWAEELSMSNAGIKLTIFRLSQHHRQLPVPPFTNMV